MPRSGPNGTYTLPGAQDEAQPNTTIQSSINNQGWADIEQTFNTPQPVAYGGTGATDAPTALTNLGAAAEASVVRHDVVQALSSGAQGQARANISAAKAPTVATKSANYTVTSADDGAAIMVDADAAAVTITLPPAASVGGGFRVVVKKTDGSANTVTIDGDASETIDGALTKVLRLQRQSVALICDGSSWQVMGEGTVFESDSNANGNYVRFADGTQICLGFLTAVFFNTSRIGVSWTFPSEFIDTSYRVQATLTDFQRNWTATDRGPTQTSAKGTTSVFINVYRIGTVGIPTDAQQDVEVMAVGRWF